jgi:hypothetical protein
VNREIKPNLKFKKWGEDLSKFQIKIPPLVFTWGKLMVALEGLVFVEWQ